MANGAPAVPLGRTAEEEMAQRRARAMKAQAAQSALTNPLKRTQYEDFAANLLGTGGGNAALSLGLAYGEQVNIMFAKPTLMAVVRGAVAILAADDFDGTLAELSDISQRLIDARPEAESGPADEAMEDAA